MRQQCVNNAYTAQPPESRLIRMPNGREEDVGPLDARV